jgi:hypothetical protein
MDGKLILQYYAKHLSSTCLKNIDGHCPKGGHFVTSPDLSRRSLSGCSSSGENSYQGWCKISRRGETLLEMTVRFPPVIALFALSPPMGPSRESGGRPKGLSQQRNGGTGSMELPVGAQHAVPQPSPPFRCGRLCWQGKNSRTLSFSRRDHFPEGVLRT